MSFRWKILLSYFLVVAACVSILAFWSEKWARDSYLDRVTRDLEAETRMLARLIEADPEAKERIAAIAAATVPFRLSVIRADGTVEADSEFPGERVALLENHLNRPEVRGALQDGFGRHVRFSASVRQELLYTAVRFADGSGLIRTALPLGEIDAALSELRSSYFYRAMVVLLIGALLTWRITIRLTSSVTTLAESARRMEQGERVDAIPVRTGDEMGLLARGLERLSATVDRQFRRLESERNHLTTVLNSMTEGVLVSDRDGRITQVNPAFREMFQIERETSGATPLEILRNQEIDAMIQGVLKDGVERTIEASVFDKTLLARCAPIEMGGGTAGAVAVFHDISEIRRLESLRKDFVSNVSHELRTPLTSIRGYAETLMGEDLTPTHREFVEKILRNSAHLSEMIVELFSLARLESGDQELQWSEVSFLGLMKEMEKEFGEALQKKELGFSYENEMESDSFSAADAFIRRVFFNLIENAVKYTERGSIQVRMRSDDGQLHFSVEDTGIGIPKADLDRVFERFYRVHKDRSRQTGGSGIGLAIVKHIVQLHGGAVWAESRPGKGTTIHFTLPSRAPTSS